MGIDPRSHTPVYVQLADLLRERIESGELPPGSTLESEARLTQVYGIGREAVRMAVSILRSGGLVTTIHGHGTQVRELPQRQRAELPAGARVTARMPTGRERRELQLDEGAPVLEVHHLDSKIDIHPGDQVELFRPASS